jgi:hypothetical protein
MKSILLTISIATLLVGCSEISRLKKDETCASAIANLHDHWHYDAANDIFKISSRELGIQMVRDKRCFIGMSRKTVLKLFGKPNRDAPTEMRYYTSTACHGDQGERTSGCDAVQIAFENDHLTVKDIIIFSTYRSE